MTKPFGAKRKDKMKHKMIRIEFLKDIFLPRFSFKKGDVWRCREYKARSEGFDIGGGKVIKADFKIIEE